MVISEIIYPGMHILTIPAATAKEKIHPGNPQGNACSLIFELALADTGETLYISDIVSPGDGIGSIRLIKPLPKGEYRAWLIIRAYDPKIMEEADRRSVMFTLIAEN